MCKTKLRSYERHRKYSKHKKGGEKVIKYKERDRQKWKNDNGIFFQPAAELNS
jgi:hypothetical protein